jgi:hypothetical protein
VKISVNAASAVNHVVVACETWHRAVPLAAHRPRTGHAAHAAAMQPEFLARKAAILAVNREAFPVNPHRMSV